MSNMNEFDIHNERVICNGVVINSSRVYYIHISLDDCEFQANFTFQPWFPLSIRQVFVTGNEFFPSTRSMFLLADGWNFISLEECISMIQRTNAVWDQWNDFFDFLTRFTVLVDLTDFTSKIEEIFQNNPGDFCWLLSTEYIYFLKPVLRNVWQCLSYFVKSILRMLYL